MSIDSSDVKVWLETHRDKPGVVANSVLSAMRASRRGEAMVMPLYTGKMHALADEGSYFVVQNATTATGLATSAAPTSFDATIAFANLYNTATASEGTHIYLDKITLRCTAAGTAGASLWCQLVIDGSNRFSSGGTAFTPINTCMDSTAASAVTCYMATDLTLAAATSSARKVFGGQIRTVIPVIGDRYVLDFGNPQAMPNGLAVGGTAVCDRVLNVPPVVIGPTHNFSLHMWLPSQSAASSYEIQIGWWER